MNAPLDAHSPHNDVRPEVNPLVNAPVRLDLNPSDFQLGREINRPVQVNLPAGMQLPDLSYMAHEAPHAHSNHGDDAARHAVAQHHAAHHHEAHRETHHAAHHEPHHEIHHAVHHAASGHAGHHFSQHSERHEKGAPSLTPAEIAAIRKSWGVTLDGALRPTDTRIPPSHTYGSESFDPPSLRGAAWTQKILRETAAALEGQSPQVLERDLDPRLGCARCVTQFGHRAYGLPITDSVANLEASMQARNFERVPMNAQTIAQMQPGDIIVGHRSGSAGGGALHGHTAIYMGDNTIFSDNSLTGKMTTASLNTFREPLRDRNGHVNQNGYSDVWIYRPRANAT